MNEALGKYKPASEQFEFRKYPFYWVIRVSNRYTHLMEKRLKQTGMNITSWRVALILREFGKISMTEIATHAVGRMPTINKTVYRMHDKGLVEVHTNENDGRVTMVSITEQGLAMINHHIKETEQIINRAFWDMGEKDIEQLNRLLKKVFDNLSD